MLHHRWAPAPFAPPAHLPAWLFGQTVPGRPRDLPRAKQQLSRFDLWRSAVEGGTATAKSDVANRTEAPDSRRCIRLLLGGDLFPSVERSAVRCVGDSVTASRDFYDEFL